MSQENVEIIRRLYDAAAHRDSDVVLALYDPEVEVDMSHAPCRDLVGQRLYYGHDGLRTFYREWHGAWETVEADVEELIDAGERVVSVETTRARGVASGAVVEVHQCGIWTLRDGKIVRVEWLDATREEALEAAGLSEQALSQENVEIVRRLYADPRGLTAATNEMVAPEAEFDFTAVYPDKPILRGVDEARHFRDSGPWSGSPIQFEPERFFDVDDERCSCSFG